MQNTNSYVGVTGFTTEDQVSQALAAMPTLEPTPCLMVGVPVSWKSLRGLPLKDHWKPFFPDPREIGRIFAAGCGRTLNLIHYSSDRNAATGDLLHDLQVLRQEYGSPYCDGFQLNVLRPDPDVLAQYRDEYPADTLVLQVGAEMVQQAGSPQGLTDQLARYDGLTDRLLLDPSGGRGQPFDPVWALELLRAIAQRQWEEGFLLGIAGGLGPNTLGPIMPIVLEFREISIDAQGQLRNGDNELVLESVVRYLQRALRILVWPHRG